MNYLKKFNERKERDIAKICKEFGIENWSIRDGLVDVDGGVNLSRRRLLEIPLKFGRVSGSFYCDGNKLTTLRGAPSRVGGSFSCSYNKLVTLEGAPGSVGGDFYCHGNKLVTLEGAPGSVRGDFDCSYNEITTLEGAPVSIGDDFYCAGNPIYGMWKLFEDFKRIEFFNDLDIVRDPIDGKPSFILDRLNFFLETIGRKPVTGVEGWIAID